AQRPGRPDRRGPDRGVAEGPGVRRPDPGRHPDRDLAGQRGLVEGPEELRAVLAALAEHSAGRALTGIGFPRVGAGLAPPPPPYLFSFFLFGSFLTERR